MISVSFEWAVHVCVVVCSGGQRTSRNSFLHSASDYSDQMRAGFGKRKRKALTWPIRTDINSRVKDLTTSCRCNRLWTEHDSEAVPVSDAMHVCLIWAFWLDMLLFLASDSHLRAHRNHSCTCRGSPAWWRTVLPLRSRPPTLWLAPSYSAPPEWTQVDLCASLSLLTHTQTHTCKKCIKKRVKV